MFIMKKTKVNNEILALDFGFNQRYSKMNACFSREHFMCPSVVHLIRLNRCHDMTLTI